MVETTSSSEIRDGISRVVSDLHNGNIFFLKSVLEKKFSGLHNLTLI